MTLTKEGGGPAFFSFTMYKIACLIGLLSVLVATFSRCFQANAAGTTDSRGPVYAGAKTCVSCHQPVFNSYIHNNHFKTSSPADTPSLLLRTMAGAKDAFYFLDSTQVIIEEKDNGVFQSLSAAPGKSSPTRSEKFELAFGSGEKAQTYGYWREGKLYQLPLTWFSSLNTWANSPGFPPSHARYNRIITSRCFECHASYVKRTIDQSGPLTLSETLDPNSIIYGIDCERCHGPGLEHVRFHQENPAVKTANFIARISSLSRQQQLDLCATCHSGNDQETQRSLFDFVPGDTLAHYYYPSFGTTAGEPDVHGQQLQLLRLSKCFAGSAMTCSTCHSTHRDQETTMAYITKCLSCHQNSAHATDVMKENEQRKRDFNLPSVTCIDCHMPLLPSKLIILNDGAGSRTIPYRLRTHKIAIYK
jgi:hypothetical protein